MTKTIFILLLFILCLLPVRAFAARTFDGTTQGAQALSVSVTTATLSASFWLNVASWTPANNSVVVEFSGNYAGSVSSFAVEFTTAGNFFVALNGDVGASSANYTPPSTSAWHHFLAVLDKSLATNEVGLYIDGVLQTPTSRPDNSNNTNNFSAHSLNFMARNSAVDLYAAGQIADIAIWDVILSGANATSLASGTSPATIQAANLKGFWKFCGTASPETDSSTGAHDATLFAGPTQSTHPTSSCAGVRKRKATIFQ